MRGPGASREIWRVLRQGAGLRYGIHWESGPESQMCRPVRYN